MRMFEARFKVVRVLDFGYESLKARTNIRISSFVHPSKIFVWGAQVFFNYSSPKSSTHTLEKCFPGKRIRKGWFSNVKIQHSKIFV